MSESPGFTSGPGGVPTAVYEESSQFPSVAAGGLPGATAGARLAGGTASGPPAAGTFGYLDVVPDGNGLIWVCTAGGTPGTWESAAGGVAIVTPSGDAAGASDPVSLNAAVAALAARGGGVVRGLAAGPWYLAAPIVMRSNVTLDMTGCVVTEVANSNCNMITNIAATAPAATGTGSMTSGANTLTTSLASVAVPGQSVYVANGSNGGSNVLCGLVGTVSTGAGTLTVVDFYGAALNAAANVSAQAVTLYDRDSNITVIGGTWNRGANGFLGEGGPGYSPLACTTNFKRADGLNISGLTVTCASKGYNIHYGDVTNYHIHDITVSAPTGIANTDGCTGHGPLAFGLVENFYGTSGDDFTALGCLDTGLTEDTTGNIADITFANLYPQGNGGSALTLYGDSSSCQMLRITARGVHGSSAVAAVHIWSGTAYNYLDDILIEDCDNAAAGSLINIFASSPDGQITLRDLSWAGNPGTSTGNSMVYVAAGTTLGALTVDGMAFECTYATVIGLQIAGTISTVNVRDLRQMNPAITTGNLILLPNGASVDVLSLEGAHLLIGTTSTPVIFIGDATAKVIQVSDAYLSGSGALLLSDGASTPAMQVILNGVTLDGAGYLADALTTIDFVISGLNVRSIAQGGLIYTAGSGAAVSVRGAGIRNPNGVALFTLATGESAPPAPRVVCAEALCDLSTLSRANNGDIAYNTNASLSCNVGVAISDGGGAANSWKNLFSGLTY